MNIPLKYFGLFGIVALLFVFGGGFAWTGGSLGTDVMAEESMKLSFSIGPTGAVEDVAEEADQKANGHWKNVWEANCSGDPEDENNCKNCMSGPPDRVCEYWAGGGDAPEVAGATVSGTLKTNPPVPNTRVYLEADDGTDLGALRGWEATTDDEGNFEITGVNFGNYSLKVDQNTVPDGYNVPETIRLNLSIREAGETKVISDPSEDYDDGVNITSDVSVDTRSVQNIDTNSAQLRGEITGISGGSNAVGFFQYREMASAEWIKTTEQSGLSENDIFTETIDELNDNTQYRFRAVAKPSGSNTEIPSFSGTFTTNEVEDSSDEESGGDGDDGGSDDGDDGSDGGDDGDDGSGGVATASASDSWPLPAGTAQNTQLSDLSGDLSGSELWSFDYPGDGGFGSIPVVADVTGDGSRNVIVGAGASITDDDFVFTLSNSGDTEWQYELEDPVSSIAVGNVVRDNGRDGELEVVVHESSFGDTLYVFDGENGDVIWSFETGGGSSRGPYDLVLDDITGDDALEVIVSGNSLWVLDGDENPAERVLGEWTTAAEQIATGEMGDGSDLVATEVSPNTLHGLTWTGSDLSESWTSEEAENPLQAPVIADLTGDENKEVIVGEGTASNDGGALHAIDPTSNGDALWTKTLPDANTDRDLPVKGPPAVGDLDGDGSPEVLVGTQIGDAGDQLFIFNGEDGSAVDSRSSGSTKDFTLIGDLTTGSGLDYIFSHLPGGFNPDDEIVAENLDGANWTFTGHDSPEPAAIADVTGNGDPELVVSDSGGLDRSGKVFVIE